MYDVIRQAERIVDNRDPYNQHHHHQSSANHTTYQPTTSFRRVDPRQAYSLYGLHDSAIPYTVGIYRSNYSPVSPAWTEYIPAQHATWSKPVIVDAWAERRWQYGDREVDGAYRHALVTPPSAVAGTAAGLAGVASRLSRCNSPGLASASVQQQQQQHYVTSRAHSGVTCADDDDVTPRGGPAASPQSATYRPSSSESATSNISFIHYCTLRVIYRKPS